MAMTNDETADERDYAWHLERHVEGPATDCRWCDNEQDQ